jgi:hypothetical protein
LRCCCLSCCAFRFSAIRQGRPQNHHARGNHKRGNQKHAGAHPDPDVSELAPGRAGSCHCQPPNAKGRVASYREFPATLARLGWHLVARKPHQFPDLLERHRFRIRQRNPRATLLPPSVKGGERGSAYAEKSFCPHYRGRSLLQCGVRARLRRDDPAIIACPPVAQPVPSGFCPGGLRRHFVLRCAAFRRRPSTRRRRPPPWRPLLL